MGQRIRVFGTQWSERRHHALDGFIPDHIGLHIFDHGHIGVVVVDLLEFQHAAAEFEIAEKRIQIAPHGGNEVVVYRGRHIIGEERRLPRRGIIPRSGVEDIGTHRICQAGCKGESMLGKFLVELVECGLAHGGLPLLEE